MFRLQQNTCRVRAEQQEALFVRSANVSVANLPRRPHIRGVTTALFRGDKHA